jgi:hypothetical protein
VIATSFIDRAPLSDASRAKLFNGSPSEARSCRSAVARQRGVVRHRGLARRQYFIVEPGIRFRAHRSIGAMQKRMWFWCLRSVQSISSVNQLEEGDARHPARARPRKKIGAAYLMRYFFVNIAKRLYLDISLSLDFG